jgi:acylpyruvate hydrolase
MRLVTFRTEFGTRAGRLDDDQVTPLEAPDVGALLATTGWRERALAAEEPPRPLDILDLAPVVPRPAKIICIGQNYRGHIEEMGGEVPEHPTLFAKYARALIGARDDIVLPRVSDSVDWEVELAVVVGKPIRHVEAEEAQGAIAGFTVANDISVRDWQRRTPQWLQGKTFEATTPLGPALVTPDEVDGGTELAIRCEVDGRTVQESTTAEMVFPPAQLLSYISTILTLEPGDVILTGTPGGVGAGRDPQEFLAPGQVVRSVVDGLGECSNATVKEEG